MRLSFVVLVLALPALAQQSGPGQLNLEQGKGGDRPWAAGVSDAQQKAALVLFKEGNAALKEPNYLAAVQKYREALTHWDHPAIHYNMAMALLNLDQPLETHSNLQAALKFGAAPLDADKAEQAQRYLTLLEKQLAKVDIRCGMEGALVKLDGTLLFTAPGRHVGLITAGTHAIVAAKEGYITTTLDMVLPAGQTKVFELNLHSTDDEIEYKRLWPLYMPYLVTALGVALAGAGAALHVGAAQGTFRAYDQMVDACYQAGAFNGGCRVGSDLDAVYGRAQLFQGIGIAAYAVGGAVLGAGLILMYANRLQPYKISIDVTGPKAALVPSITPGGAGAAFVLLY